MDMCIDKGIGIHMHMHICTHLRTHARITHIACMTHTQAHTHCIHARTRGAHLDERLLLGQLRCQDLHAPLCAVQRLARACQCERIASSLCRSLGYSRFRAARRRRWPPTWRGMIGLHGIECVDSLDKLVRRGVTGLQRCQQLLDRGT